MASRVTIYPSKVDLWLAAVLVLAPLFVIGLGVYLTLNVGPAGIISIFVGLLIGVVIAVLAIPCRYTLTDQSLVIRCGLLHEEIKIERINEATPTSNPLSAPALSLKRVKIQLDQGFRLISPNNREQFIQDLKERIEAANERRTQNIRPS